ncbi:hypothetical protein TSOC_003256 [Tetrabaena socialis]|uniref:Uncharacterized protein n=1 Tax=Tetrabaena socialis TaxID=47790 RepID=A0A2J8AC22_9CHLO|nr:hypothetical protein TSOC_003256 [Tetrabaena socialis]|eukprot:PNH10061.1 hypothetical protein TSOC_003256 [Tetrabaena socialis]
MRAMHPHHTAGRQPVDPTLPGSRLLPLARPVTASRSGARGPTAPARSTTRPHAAAAAAAAAPVSGSRASLLDASESTTEMALGAPGVRVVSLSPASPDLPFLLYLPDIDGAGVTSNRQWEAWKTRFELHALSLDPESDCDFAALAAAVRMWLEARLQGGAPQRPVYLLGEGFGGVLALQLALDCRPTDRPRQPSQPPYRRQVNRLILVNPATSYAASPLARLAPLLERLPPALLTAQLPQPPAALAALLPPGFVPPTLPLPMLLAPILGRSPLNLFPSSRARDLLHPCTSPQSLARQLLGSIGSAAGEGGGGGGGAVEAVRLALESVMVEEMLAERGVLMRGLAHPGLFQPPGGPDPDGPQEAAPAHSGGAADSKAGASGRGGGGGGEEDGLPPSFMGNMFQSFGAVRVTPTAMYRLLAAGEAVLLYPGGVREGFKRRNEKYELFWPSRPHAARTRRSRVLSVSPVSLSLLFGDRARDQAAAAPRARVGVAADSSLDESFIPPLIAPAVPSRFYYLFGRPIRTSPAMAKDRAACDQVGAVYQAVRADVEDGISYLLRKRETDPHRDFLPRLLYESNPPFGPRRQAPTFKL